MTNVLSAELPKFRYHPDPLQSGSLVASDKKCRCCKLARGFLYTGSVYCEDDLKDALCPWCIADGTAHKKLGATFNDSEGFADGIAEAAMNEIIERTPGFCSWQQGKWLSCCGEPAAFLEPMGLKEIRAKCYQVEGALMPYIVHELGISGGAAVRVLASLQRDQSPTAYVFKCLHCDNHPAYVDYL